jgi:hypothetical protein
MKRVNSAKDLRKLVRAGRMTMREAIKTLREEERALKDLLVEKEKRLEMVAKTLTVQQVIGLLYAHVDGAHARRRAGGLKTGAMKRARADQSWPLYLADYKELLKAGMQPWQAAKQVNAKHNFPFNDDYMRKTLKKLTRA